MYLIIHFILNSTDLNPYKNNKGTNLQINNKLFKYDANKEAWGSNGGQYETLMNNMNYVPNWLLIRE